MTNEESTQTAAANLAAAMAEWTAGRIDGERQTKDILASAQERAQDPAESAALGEQARMHRIIADALHHASQGFGHGLGSAQDIPPQDEPYRRIYRQAYRRGQMAKDELQARPQPENPGQPEPGRMLANRSGPADRSRTEPGGTLTNESRPTNQTRPGRGPHAQDLLAALIAR